MKPNIHLHIERLVLNGFHHEDRHAIAAGLQQELSSLLADPQAVQSLTGLGDISQLQVGRLSIAQGLKPRGIGVQVAQGIGKEFRK